MIKNMDIFVNITRGGHLIIYGIVGCDCLILLRWIPPPGPLSPEKILINIMAIFS
jgi:hypothetical protein